MEPISYNFSFIFSKWPQNRVRFWVESRILLIDETNGNTEQYYQCGSCKSEDTFAKADLFYPDNWDFTPIFGPEHSIVFRRAARLTDTYKSLVKTADLFQGPEYAVKNLENAVLLETNDEICERYAEGIPMVAQTEIWNEDTKMRAIIEYPIKTLNVHRENKWYQVDTGPVLLPDLSKRYERNVDGISLAYVAFNVPTFADFISEVPTNISDGENSCMMLHYSEISTHQAINRVFMGY